MKQEKAILIENMKKQTFGVEVEMNNITRRNAAKVAAEFFGTNDYQRKCDAYLTWSAFDANGREWKFSRDSSISGPDEERCEMVTPVLKYEDMEQLQELIRVLRKNGAKSNPDRGCGVHIHVGGNGHTVQSIKVLCEMMRRYENELVKMVGIDSDRLSCYCKTINPRFLTRLLVEKPTTMDELKYIWYDAQGSYVTSTHYNSTRYHMLNLHAFFNRYNTIEFRLFQFDNPSEGKAGGLHAGQLKAMIQLCLAMNNYAKTVSYCRTSPKTEIDELTSMKRWMSKMGMVGSEFKTAIEYFTRNASKDAKVNVSPLYLTNRYANEHGCESARSQYYR